MLRVQDRVHSKPKNREHEGTCLPISQEGNAVPTQRLVQDLEFMRSGFRVKVRCFFPMLIRPTKP